jgi:hypothetical protein
MVLPRQLSYYTYYVVSTLIVLNTNIYSNVTFITYSIYFTESNYQFQLKTIRQD